MLRPAVIFSLLLASIGAAHAQEASAAPQGVEPAIVVEGRLRDDRSRWMRAESANFIVYGPDGETALRRETVRLEHFHQLLRLVTDVRAAPAANKLPIYLLEHQAQVERLRSQPLPRGFFATGYYSAAPSGALAAADTHWDKRGSPSFRHQDVWLFTEYSRHFLLQHAGGAYLPSWYVDGFGYYMSTTRFAEDRITFGQGHPSLVYILNTERWPLRELLSGRLARGHVYSALSMMLVHYIFADDRRTAAFRRFLADAGAGAEPVGAFTRAFGTDVDELRSALWAYKNKVRYRELTGVRYANVEIDVASFPRSADRLLLDQATLRIGIAEEGRRGRALRQARATVGQRQDPFAQRVAAQAEALFGDGAAADRLLEPLLDRMPDDAELLYLKGLRHLVAGRADPSRQAAEFAAARGWFTRAHRADATFYPALYGYAESLSTDPRFLSDNTQNVLLLAARIAPQATQVHVTAAHLLMHRGKFADAAAVLNAVIVSPRDPASEQVPRLLAMARAGQRSTKAELIDSFRYTANWRDLNCC
jgi:hypothetical protein